MLSAVYPLLDSVECSKLSGISCDSSCDDWDDGLVDIHCDELLPEGSEKVTRIDSDCSVLSMLSLLEDVCRICCVSVHFVTKPNFQWRRQIINWKRYIEIKRRQIKSWFPVENVEMSNFEHPVTRVRKFFELSFFRVPVQNIQGFKPYQYDMKKIARHPHLAPKKIYISTKDPWFPSVWKFASNLVVVVVVAV